MFTILGIAGILFYILGTAAFSWSTATIDDTASDVGENMSIIMESATLVHAAYSNDAGTNDPVRYNTITSGVAGTPEDVIATSTSLAARNVRIALDGTTPVIALQGNTDDLIIAFRNGSGQFSGVDSDWTYTPIVTSTYAVFAIRGIGFAISSGGRYGVTFHNNTAGDDTLIYGTCTSTCTSAENWTFETVDSSFAIVGRYPDIAFTSGGVPVISYLDATNSNVKYAIRNATAPFGNCTDTDWNCYVVDDALQFEGTSIAVDANDKIGVVYQRDNGDQRLFFAYQDSGDIGCDAAETAGFTCGVVTTTANTYARADMIFHGTVPLVTWHTQLGTEDLEFSYKNGDSWTNEVILSTGDIGDFPSISRYGNEVRIGHYDVTSRDADIASATVSFNTAPVLSSFTTSTTSNGSGDITVSVNVNDADTNTVKVKTEYKSGACSYSGQVTSTLASATVTTSTVTLDNGASDSYQLTGISTAVTNTLGFTWKSATDVPAGDGAYCLFLTPSDGTDAGTTVSSTIILDNVDPTAPGNLTMNTTSTQSVIVNFSTSTTETNFREYKIFAASSTVVSEASAFSFTSSTLPPLGSQTYSPNTTTTLSGLATSTLYTTNIWAYDSYGNTSSAATALTFYTLAAAPGTPSVSVSSTVTSSLTLVVDRGTNPNDATTTYSICLTSDASTCAANGYVEANGSLGASAVWQTYSAWGSTSGIAVTGLSANTSYRFLVKARNGNTVETAFSSASTAVYTLANPVTNFTPSNTTTSSTLQIQLSWSNASQTGMRIRRDESCNGTYDTTLYNNTSTNDTTPTTTVGLSANTCYVFEAASYNGDGQTSSNDISMVTTSQITTPPGAPTGLSATATASTTITWSWSSVTNANSYVVVNAGTGVTIATTTEISYQQTDLTPNTQYGVYVRAHNTTNGTGTASSVAYSFTNASTPTNITHSNQTTSTLTLSWVTTGVESYAQLQHGDSGVMVSTTGWISATSAAFIGLSPNVAYTMGVKARNASSTETGFTSSTFYTSQYAVSTVSFSTSTTSITVTSVGSFPNNDGSHGSSVVHFENNVGGSSNNTTVSTNPSWENTDLSANTQYTYYLYTKNGDGDQTATTSASLFTLANQADAPTLANPTVSTIGITMNGNGNASSTTYALYNQTTGVWLDANGAASATSVYQTTSTWGNISATGLSVNTQYSFVVIARNGDGVNAATSTASALYTLANPPGTLTATPDSTAITLHWSQSGNPNGTQFYPLESGGQSPGWMTNTSWTATNLSCGTSYQFQVKAKNGNGVETALSNILLAQTNPCSSSGGDSYPVPPPPPPPLPPAIDEQLDDLEEQCPTCVASGAIIIKKNGQPIVFTNTKNVIVSLLVTYGDSVALKESSGVPYASSDSHFSSFWSGISFQSILPEVPWTLTGSDGIKCMNAKFKFKSTDATHSACVILDTKAPPTPFLKPIDLSAKSPSGVRPKLVGRAEPEALIIITKKTTSAQLSGYVVLVARSTLWIAVDTTTYYTTVNGTGDWAFDFPVGLPSGNYTISAQAQDKAGNISGPTEQSIVVSLDGSPVLPPLDLPPDILPPTPPPSFEPDISQPISVPSQTGQVETGPLSPFQPGKGTNSIDENGQALPSMGTSTIENIEGATLSPESEIIALLTSIQKTIRSFVDNPKIEAITEKIVGPGIAAVGIANIAIGFQLPQVLNILRYLFTQPFMLLRLRKKKTWGVVYNAYTKQPIDLAVVRVFDSKTNRIVRSQVTDRDGRYLILIEPGEYRIEVDKVGFSRTSMLMKGKIDDGTFLHVYGGGTVRFTEKKSMVLYNIPADPVDDARPATLVIRQHIRRGIHVFVGFLGFAIAFLSVLVAPTLYMIGFLVLHIALFILFYFFIYQRLPSAYGRIVSQGDKKAVGNVVIRAFDAQYSKLVETTVSDFRGRYALLVGPSTYFVTYEKPGFKKKQSPLLDYSSSKTEGEGGVIHRNEVLEALVK